MNAAYESILNAELAIEAKTAKRSVARLSKKAIARATAAAEAKWEASMTKPLEHKATEANRETKRSVAAEVFNSMVGARRKNVIASMMSHADLSKAGASTYYQNFHSGKWAS